VTQTVRASALPAPAPERAWLLRGPLSKASLTRRHSRARRPRSGEWRIARPPPPASSACSAGRPCLPRVLSAGGLHPTAGADRSGRRLCRGSCRAALLSTAKSSSHSLQSAHTTAPAS
jgi:hypothetical protein